MQATMTSGSGADTTGDTRGVGLASMGIRTAGAAENSERNPRLFIPYLTNERATPKVRLCGRGRHGSGYLFVPPVNGNSTVVPERSTVIRPLCQSATRSAAVATLYLCASISLPVQPMVRPLPVPTAQHSRNRWSASSVEDPKAATVSSRLTYMSTIEGIAPRQNGSARDGVLSMRPRTIWPFLVHSKPESGLNTPPAKQIPEGIIFPTLCTPAV
jgi:hypothetical protein